MMRPYAAKGNYSNFGDIEKVEIPYLLLYSAMVPFLKDSFHSH